METEEKVSKGYILGFNHGYILAKNDPLLLSQLHNKQGENDYLIGVKAGEVEYLKEVQIQKLKEHFDINKSSKRSR